MLWLIVVGDRVEYQMKDTRSCGKEKPRVKLCIGQEIGKDVAEKSNGLFSPQDWVCTKCNNVNWARRNVCKAKKFGGTEARTGYGGGYMDHDEFDEFGRKKKGIKRSSGVMKSEYSDGEEEFDRKARKYEEEEEEEDESGDDDLGKYDFGSDDEFESLKNSLAKKVAEANNASRASSPCSCSCSEGEDQICSCDESDTERTSRDQRPSSSESRSDRRRHHNQERRRYRNDYDRHYRAALSSSRRAIKEGEWACVDSKCAYINRETYTSCRSCGKEKPRVKLCVGQEIGKDVAEKSNGLFSPQDWVCTKCNNVNWARRNVCNVCKAKKFGGTEARTGYGGGYMDRQDVEYISRKTDDEFDEFGLMVKKSLTARFANMRKKKKKKRMKAVTMIWENMILDRTMSSNRLKTAWQRRLLKRIMLHARQVPVPAPVAKVKIRFARAMNRILSGRLGINVLAALKAALTVVGIIIRNAIDLGTIMTVTIEVDVIVILTNETIATTIDEIVILISGIVLVLNLPAAIDITKQIHPGVAIVDNHSTSVFFRYGSNGHGCFYCLLRSRV
ncbi:hypothetical protein QR680_001117 [Steinernema hermaphroditum]|uniref:RanBP2-type domain-containing protein n=1 Tax=Steinernema hermaphroditum TaxID=289476 RepID=A0AA39GZR9_9BILA|nr:hypothetical protein QR680_001117 [Steinernema hermaphroditum]